MSETGPSTPERRVLGELSNTKAEPISPTANLRLLISLASNLKSLSESENQGSCANKIQKDNFSPVPSETVGSKVFPRKQKSLGLLCKKFLNLYPLDIQNGSPLEISLDSTAKSLGTEKRRIYDIINVLESLEMASKAGKNRYLWHGQNNLTLTLGRLKSTAIRLGLREQIQDIQKTNKAYIGDNEDIDNNESTMFVEELLDEESNDSDVAIKEDKSLGAMCQKFIMLFLVSMKNGVINLDIAAKVLILDVDNQLELSDITSRSRFKTKVRRLYDIANVLTAIGLIKKVYIDNRAMKKPIFKYTGTEVETIDSETGTPIHQIYKSPLGMSTPHKRISSLTREIRINTLVHSDSKTLLTSNTTPIIDKRKLRKRKLFDSVDSAFPRTYSLPNLGKSRSSERLDDSILRVAEMELEKLNSSEESIVCKPKACTKLFPRYNSDSCLRNVSHITPEKLNDALVEIKSPNQTVSFIKLPLAMNNNILVSGNNAFYVKNTTNLNVTRPINTESIVSRPFNNKIMRLLPIGNINSINSGDKKIIIAQNKNNNNIINKNMQPANVKTKPTATKIIKLTKIDPTKLISIKKSDLKIPMTSAKSQQVTLEKVNNLNTNYAMLTPIQATKLSPGDTFKAIKVGNSLQLVPIKCKSNENTNHLCNNEN